jgi:hypothetical protein
MATASDDEGVAGPDSAAGSDSRVGGPTWPLAPRRLAPQPATRTLG